MRRMVAVWMAAALSVAAATGWAAETQALDLTGLKAEARQNTALSRYLKTNGYPDVAAVKTVVDQPPWDDHEVTLYYLSQRREISFARARILGKPEVHLKRYQRQLTDSDVRSLSQRPPLEASRGGDDSPCTGNATARAECSATRAENAAERIDLAAARTEKAAERTEAIVEKMAAAKSPRRR